MELKVLYCFFASKYQRKIFYELRRKEIMQFIRELCQWKGIEILEEEMAIDHAHQSSASANVDRI